MQADPASAQNQFEAMRQVAHAMQEDIQNSVPRPYLLDAQRGLLAMEWVTGTSMTDALFTWRCSMAQAQALMTRAGLWLRRFHASRTLPSGVIDLAEKLAFVDEMAQSNLTADPVFCRALAQLRQAAPRACATLMPRSWLHGDFKTDNLLLCDGRTLGIDIHLRYEDVVVQDLAPFLNFIDLRLLHPSGWRLAPARESLEKSFLAAYMDKPIEGIDAPLTWVRLYLVLVAWHSLHALAGSRIKLAVLDFFQRRVALKLTRQLEAGA